MALTKEDVEIVDTLSTHKQKISLTEGTLLAVGGRQALILAGKDIYLLSQKKATLLYQV